MSPRTIRRPGPVATGALFMMTAFFPGEAWGQGGDPAALEAYTRLASAHFQVSQNEVALLAEERIQPDEVAVVLRISQVSGISPTALIALRRSGESWMGIARRYGMGASSFHEPVPAGAIEDRTRRAMAAYGDTPATSWDSIQLTDDEVVTLVNLRMLTRELGVSHAQVLTARSQAGSYMQALRVLAR